MAKVTIEGKSVEVENGTTVIRAAAQAGIEIPHFCWHPGLSIAGNCRMCLVEIEKMPKLAIACATQVADGMVVHVNSQKALEARKAILEFILINHPLDCPICDEAGECNLQDYTYSHGPGQSAFTEAKNKKPKRVPLGPNVVYDAERCILCSRCIRVMDEIVKNPTLTFVERGDRVFIDTFPGKELNDPYSMNVIDVCPVGALTNREYRFRARVWEMSSTEGICPGCARGCNINIWVRDNEILRLTPSHNPDVNSYWMCDNGRLNSFKHVNSQVRLNSPMVRKDGVLQEVGWDEALAHAADALKPFSKDEVAVIGSAYSSVEDNYVLQKFAKQILGTANIGFLRHSIEGDEDNLLIRADKTPNGYGAREVGVASSKVIDTNIIFELIGSGKIKALYVMDDDVAVSKEMEDLLTKLDVLIVNHWINTRTTQLANVVFPSATFAEKYGTYVNFLGRVQLSRPALSTLGQSRVPGRFNLSRLDKFGSIFDKWNKGTRRNVRSSWEIICAIGNLLGGKIRYQSAEKVFEEIAQVVPSFKGLSYAKLGDRGALLKKAKEEALV
ncbi:MAG TPA: molybdopterin-dependent oxidoreductase [Candidatus Acidoferrales bacterium]|nr:molybdopterin-dependent oxidoreductase [Candidatus Acidoferrales bacterium]